MNRTGMVRCSYIADLIYDMFRVQTAVLNLQGESILRKTGYMKPHPLYSYEQEYNQMRSAKSADDHYPSFYMTAFGEHYCYMPVMEEGTVRMHMFIGPVLNLKMNKLTLKGIMNDMNYHVQLDELLDYFETLPILQKNKFYQLSRMIHYMLYQEMIHERHISSEFSLNINQDERSQIEGFITQYRQNYVMHNDPQIEKRIFECVKTGKSQDVPYYFQQLYESGELGVLSPKSLLRNNKNLAIAGITLATRSAIEGGLNIEVAYTLSDLSIQQVESMTNANEVMHYSQKIIVEFALRVQKQLHTQYSPIITKCIDFIYSHVYQELNVHLIAGYLKLHPVYVSNLFRHEVGQALGTYIQRIKIEEAKVLLKYTSHSLLEIATMLNYYDQSYFTKVFKKMEGVTPRQYKQGLLT